MGETKRIVDVLWCGNGDPLTVRIGCDCEQDFRDCNRIRIRMVLAHWRIGNSRRISFRRQVVRIHHQPSQLQQQHPKSIPK